MHMNINLSVADDYLYLLLQSAFIHLQKCSQMMQMCCKMHMSQTRDPLLWHRDPGRAGNETAEITYEITLRI
jgi:hypothetical protein